MKRVAIIGAAISAAALAGCSTGTPASGAASTGGSFTNRYVEAPALLAQCGIAHGTITPPTNQPWYRNGKVRPLSGSRAAGRHAAELSTWWDMRAGDVIGGRKLADWDQWAARHDRLPPPVCGPGVSASQLAARLYPGRSNPWS